MKILYATGRYSPLKHDEGSGTDYMLFHSIQDTGINVDFVGPFENQPSPLEAVYRKAHRLFSSKRPAKYTMRMLKKGANSLKEKERIYQPDVIFSKNLAPLVFFESQRPIIYMLDSAVTASNLQYPVFSKFEASRMAAWEKKVLQKSCHVITRSQWTKEVLINDYGYPAERIDLVMNSASLPKRVIPEVINPEMPVFSEIRLLVVAKEFHRKGIDIAISVVDQLNSKGLNAKLHIVGCKGEDLPNVKYLGVFHKAVESELLEYVSNYAWPHFLLHPARYDAAPIVTCEAAAFGVPTLTNAVGGLATTVQDGVSGVVLPALSPAKVYVKVIEHYIQNPNEYMTLSRSTRERYEKELNWEAAGKRIVEIIRLAITDKEKGSP